MRTKTIGFALSAMLFALCVPADAQQPKKVPRIGYLAGSDPTSESTRIEAIRLALRELGYIEGQNIASEYRYAEGKQDRYPELAAELVRLKVDIIVVPGGNAPTRAAMNTTKTIPIVMMGLSADPVELGLVESLARPGGNVTGLTTLSRELGAQSNQQIVNEATRQAVLLILSLTPDNSQDTPRFFPGRMGWSHESTATLKSPIKSFNSGPLQAVSSSR
jgi:putative ABC transport system substrate-binding protein